jgi:hypothetical protein
MTVRISGLVTASNRVHTPEFRQHDLAKAVLQTLSAQSFKVIQRRDRQSAETLAPD